MTIRFIVRCFTVAGLLLSAQVAGAQQAQQTPAQALSQFANGGAGMESVIQSLMKADKNNLAAIIAFAKTANEDQRKASGKALAEVAKAYAAANSPADANTVQQAVVTAGLPELAKAYADAGGDTGTAATGGPGGGGGGTGPIANGGQNSGGVTGATNFANNASSLTGGTLGGGGFSTPSPR